MMLTSYMKLSLVILLGAMTLGLSSVAVAKDDFVATNWIAAHKKLDCPTTCRENFALKYVMMGGVDQKERKPLSICATSKIDKRGRRQGEWLVGYNRWKENTCIVGIDGKEYRGEKYFCLFAYVLPTCCNLCDSRR